MADFASGGRIGFNPEQIGGGSAGRISMKKIWILLFACIAWTGVVPAESPKYIFLFIGDGMAAPQRILADEFSRKQGNGPLAMNSLPCHATTRTCSASSLVTDSAAAATAIACGVKTANGKLGVDVNDRPVESVAEFAAARGRKVGIVSSVAITHATPGGFYAHRPRRTMTYGIGLDLIASGFDYFGGGGMGRKANDPRDPEYRGDLYELAAAAGYKLASNRAELEALRPGCGRVFARGGDAELPYELDADGTVPTLAEFTAKGIELLDNPRGFFMMVEGGSIDWCGHSNEAAGNLHEVLGLDRAIRVALKFADAHPEETLIIVTGDHETGGMTLGSAATGYALYPERLACQKRTVGAFSRRLEAAKAAKADFSFEDAKRLLTEDFGFRFDGGDTPPALKKAEISRLEAAFQQGTLPAAAREIMNTWAGVGWTTGSHTALPVLTTSRGPGAEKFTGFIENTDISKRLKELMR